MYGIIFIQCSYIVRVLSVTLLPFITSSGDPKCCQTNDLKVASSALIPVFSHVILAACSSSSSSPSLGSGRLDVAKAHYCPHRSQISRDRFLTWWEISSSLISRDLLTPLIMLPNGSMYEGKRIGPSTEPWGTPWLLHLWGSASFIRTEPEIYRIRFNEREELTCLLCLCVCVRVCVRAQLCQEDKVHGGGCGQSRRGVLLPQPGSVSGQRQPGQQLARRGARYSVTMATTPP